jgi:hypothetical protein
MDLKKQGVFLIVCVVMVFFIICSGCIGNVERNQSSGVSPVLIPTSNSSQPVQNETLWIHFDPVGTISSGNIFVITGTTNLGADEDVMITVLPANFDPRTQTTCEGRGLFGASGTIQISNISQKNVHIFSFPVDTSTSVDGVVWKPQEYTAKAIAVEYPAEDQVNFTVVPSNSSANVTYGKNSC